MFYAVELLEESGELLCVINVFVLQLRNVGHIEGKKIPSVPLVGKRKIKVN